MSDHERKRTRSGEHLNIEIKNVKFHRADPLDHSLPNKLPSYRHLYQRFLTIQQDLGREKGAWKDAVGMVASEFIYDWVMLNIYTISYKNVCKHFDRFFLDFKLVQKWPANKKHQKSYNDKADQIISKLEHGVDIFCKDESFRKDQEKEFGVKMTWEEYRMYRDNCVPEELDGVQVCKRKIWSSGIDKKWMKAAKVRQVALEQKLHYKLRRNLRLEREAQQTKLLVGDEAKAKLSEALDLQDTPEKDDETEDNFAVPEPSKGAVKRLDFSQNMEIPCIPVRTGYRSVDPRICQLLVDLESKFEIEARKSRQVLAHIANSELFKQKWEVTEDDIGDIDSEEVDMESDQSEPGIKKRRRYTSDNTYVLPSRRTVAQYVKDSALLNFKYVADHIIAGKAEGNSTVTFGSDDTKKAAGHKTMDVKTGHITMVKTDGESSTRETFSTGYLENISHSGSDNAAGVQSWLTQMSILTNVPYKELINMFDFWMNDRAGDSDASLDELEISSEKRLKCNAHILLCIDQAIDKVFKDLETTLGVQKLIGLGASHVFSGGSNSIWWLGLIAFSKLLSPSHAQQSISLFNLYKEFLTRDSQTSSETSQTSSKLLKAGFTSFSSNRFGRLPELSSTFTKHEQQLKEFYSNSVDENANKLVLACFTYLESDWFKVCCQVASEIDTVLTQPIKAALGIDKDKNSRSEFRSWEGLKELFNQKLKELEEISKKHQGMSNKEYLLASVASNIRVAMVRQLEYVDYYKQDEEVGDDAGASGDKLRFAPLTNSGCESQFADLDNSVKKFGGTANVGTLSDKHVIRKNNLFETEDWKMMNLQEKKSKFAWARGSVEAKKVIEMQKEWIEKVNSAKCLALVAKESKKKKKNERSLKLLEQCKEHNGPVTRNTADLLDSLTDRQLVTEVRYLRVTIAPNIREKVKVDKKFRKLNKAELKNEILKVIRPEVQLDSLDNLLSDILSKDILVTETVGQSSAERTSNEVLIHPGLAALWCGPLQEQCVGVVVPRGQDDVLQLYARGRHGYYEDGPAVDLQDWSVIRSIDKVLYVTKAKIVYLQF